MENCKISKFNCFSSLEFLKLSVYDSSRRLKAFGLVAIHDELTVLTDFSYLYTSCISFDQCVERNDENDKNLTESNAANYARRLVVKDVKLQHPLLRHLQCELLEF